jgi:hypothetical protein
MSSASCTLTPGLSKYRVKSEPKSEVNEKPPKPLEYDTIYLNLRSAILSFTHRDAGPAMRRSPAHTDDTAFTSLRTT